MLQGKGEIRTHWLTGEDKERRMTRLKPPRTCAKSPDVRHSSLHRTQSTSLSRQVSWRDRCQADQENKRPVNGIIHYADNGSHEKYPTNVCRHSSLQLDPTDLENKRNCKSPDVLRIQITNDEAGDSANGKDTVARRNNYLNKTRGSLVRDSSFCDDDPLLRFDTTSDNDAQRASLIRSSTEETQV